MTRTLLPLLVAAALSGCASAAAPDRDSGPSTTSAPSAPRTDTISIALGQSASLDGGRLAIRFESRVADSRCAATAICIWQGDAHVRIVTRVAGGASVPADLHSGVEPSKVVADRYTITMVGMTPYPGTGQEGATPVLIVRVASQ